MMPRKTRAGFAGSGRVLVLEPDPENYRYRGEFGAGIAGDPINSTW